MGAGRHSNVAVHNRPLGRLFFFFVVQVMAGKDHSINCRIGESSLAIFVIPPNPAAFQTGPSLEYKALLRHFYECTYVHLVDTATPADDHP